MDEALSDDDRRIIRDGICHDCRIIKKSKKWWPHCCRCGRKREQARATALTAMIAEKNAREFGVCLGKDPHQIGVPLFLPDPWGGPLRAKVKVIVDLEEIQ